MIEYDSCFQHDCRPRPQKQLYHQIKEEAD